MSIEASLNPGGGTPVEAAVRRRYARAADAREACLCTPTAYDPALLDAIPEEVIERDYGCGDPSKWLEPGDTVLDLGSGTGKICFIAAQVVGPGGRVIGVDFNEPMLALARKHQPTVADRIGYDNVTFRKGRIQDLRLDLEALEGWLSAHPVRTADDYLALEHEAERLRTAEPMIPRDSIDCIVSNCVLNLVSPQEKGRLFEEMFRVLRRGGRCVISDIVSDEDIPVHLQQDPDLWSGCISGAFREDRFLHAFEQAGFHGIELLDRQDDPWQTVEGIELRAVTVRAYKGKQGPCLDRNQAVIYRGPWKAVTDDDGHTLHRGERMAVCDKTFHLYTGGPYAGQVIPVPPRREVPPDEAMPYDCRRNTHRPARETKGAEYDRTDPGAGGSACGPGCC